MRALARIMFLAALGCAGISAPLPHQGHDDDHALTRDGVGEAVHATACECVPDLTYIPEYTEIYSASNYADLSFHTAATGRSFSYDGADVVYHSGGYVYDQVAHNSHDLLGLAVAVREYANFYIETSGARRVEVTWRGDFAPFDDRGDGMTMSTQSGMYSLGTPTAHWRDVYADGAIYLDGYWLTVESDGLHVTPAN